MHKRLTLACAMPLGRRAAVPAAGPLRHVMVDRVERPLKLSLRLALTVAALLLPLSVAAQSLTAQVNPFIGTGGTGHTFPGATVPFGMVAPSPDNAAGGWDYTSGYQYRAPRILGFSNTHISGAGIPELGDVLLQPSAGTPWRETTTDFASRSDKRSERASPGYYRVRLPAHRVQVELTATQRVALQRYRFDRPGRVQVLIDLQHGLLFQMGDEGKPAARVSAAEVNPAVAAGEIEGHLKSRNWVERQTAFVLRFDHPIERLLTLPARPGELAPRYLASFDLGRGRVLEARVDRAGARANLRETETETFDQVRSAADSAWEQHLARVRIEAPPAQRRLFYTALYHALIHPSDIADVTGLVRGPSGAVMTAPGGHYYSTLSLWDTLRAVHPLLTLVAPERVDGFVQTLIAHQQAMGYLPLWTAWGQETWTMIGNPALPVIANALASGFSGFDRDAALAAMLASSTAPRLQAPAWAQHDWDDYERLGYLPIERANGEAVSKTLEYGIGDDALARLARRLGKTELAEHFEQRALGYRKLFDPSSRMMRGRDTAGRWRSPFDPLMPTSPLNNPGDYTEANAWQYTLTPALHDPQGLIELRGGRADFEAWLDEFFSVQAPGDNKHLGQEALIGQYAHGNEPSHHIAYLYAFTASPWKGHALIRRIAREFYRDRPDGITGNDDCGQMSAWYVLSTLGFYPVVPSSGNFVLGTPLVRSARLSLPGGKLLRVVAEGFGKSRAYAARAWLNGREVLATQLEHAALIEGGELKFEMRQLPR